MQDEILFFLLLIFPGTAGTVPNEGHTKYFLSDDAHTDKTSCLLAVANGDMIAGLQMIKGSLLLKIIPEYYLRTNPHKFCINSGR